MKHLVLFVLTAFGFVATSIAQATFRATACEETYPRHVQGICANGSDANY
ncbi:MAG: hypothetical protein ACYC67_17915 [Prosthecobacter sp.]